MKKLKVYANVDLQKLEIKAANKGKSGIYCFTCLTNGKKYVGSSVNLGRRFSQYFNANYLKRHTDMLISRALLKYGYSNFNLEILEYCDSSELLTREQYYFDLLNPEYNILKNAYSSLGYKHSAESRAKMSASTLGRIFSEEHKTKISAAMKSIALGRNKNHNSISNLTLGRRKMIKISVLDLETNISTVYNYIGAAAKALNIHHSIISAYFNRNQIKPYKKRYVFTKI
jgi:group I intron endonuclease